MEECRKNYEKMMKQQWRDDERRMYKTQKKHKDGWRMNERIVLLGGKPALFHGPIKTTSSETIWVFPDLQVAITRLSFFGSFVLEVNFQVLIFIKEI